MTSQLLIADSGSTKTHWRVLSGKTAGKAFITAGINPYLQSEAEIRTVLEEQMGAAGLTVSHVWFYGAGAGHPVQQERLTNVLQSFFNAPATVAGDLLGAARALCQQAPGVVGILGTGSNACFYDGEKIAAQQISMGYLAGDEGSGNALGKRVLQYYAYHTFDEELKFAFENLFGNDVPALLRQLYQQPFPNRMLAGFVPLLAQNRGHYMVENILEDCFHDFFRQHILKLRESWKHPIHFCGSVAYEFRDVLVDLCEQFELTPGSIIKDPIEGLTKFHLQAEVTAGS